MADWRHGGQCWNAQGSNENRKRKAVSVQWAEASCESSQHEDHAGSVSRKEQKQANYNETRQNETFTKGERQRRKRMRYGEPMPTSSGATGVGCRVTAGVLISGKRIRIWTLAETWEREVCSVQTVCFGARAKFCYCILFYFFEVSGGRTLAKLIGISITSSELIRVPATCPLTRPEYYGFFRPAMFYKRSQFGGSRSDMRTFLQLAASSTPVTVTSFSTESGSTRQSSRIASTCVVKWAIAENIVPTCDGTGSFRWRSSSPRCPLPR
ncbi:hypothetical protein CROQUDRAFT_97247 [Cronartium quercuum f. sp. fusiforme G11]|uniref:Uncharacterized protein n=1 Tax=Cronartium quercuum f. sp. fusiforme G11 TaxID=708437 RepID=A0A9P6T831_9BASI|nr:hypothetical protein CROQUDRAFT_97247 [Cronartium quercuum f. sp. fusiforme G11]